MKKIIYFLLFISFFTSCIVENNYYQVVNNNDMDIYSSSFKIGKPILKVAAGNVLHITKVPRKTKQRIKYNNGMKVYSGYVFNVSPYDYNDYVEPRKKEVELPSNKNKPSSPSLTPSYNAPSRDIQTGPKGGRFYINSNGNKTYIKKGH